jgi:hypothetical protein
VFRERSSYLSHLPFIIKSKEFLSKVSTRLSYWLIFLIDRCFAHQSRSGVRHNSPSFLALRSCVFSCSSTMVFRHPLSRRDRYQRQCRFSIRLGSPWCIDFVWVMGPFIESPIVVEHRFMLFCCCCCCCCEWHAGALPPQQRRQVYLKKSLTLWWSPLSFSIWTMDEVFSVYQPVRCCSWLKGDGHAQNQVSQKRAKNSDSVPICLLKRQSTFSTCSRASATQKLSEWGVE